MVEDIKNKVNPTQHLHLHQHQHRHQLCLQTGSLHSPPLQNVRVDTQYVGIIEEQKQQIKQLQKELAEFNLVWYKTLPANASGGRNVLRSSKKVSMTPTDDINQQAVASYAREAIWPGNKMLPKSWSKWRDDKRSLCQMILKKCCITSGCGWKVILGGSDTRNHNQQVLLTEGKLQARVVWAVSR